MNRVGIGTGLVVFSLALIQPALAQGFGTIVGSVEDARTGESLSGVNVALEETSLGTISAADGTFEIVRAEPGTYVLAVSLIGYTTARSTVAVVAGKEVEVGLELSPEPIRLGEILVQADRSFSAASSRTVRQFDLQIRPKRSTQQMLQVVPGLFIAQHAGGGKAEQIFLRGFDNDHGSDVAISVDGMPVNMVSQAHGHGYADLHFIIPDVVEAMEVYKGPYFAEYGNLANAGQVVFHTRDRIEQNALRLEWGAFNTARYTMLYQLPPLDSRPAAYFAGNFYRTDGPFDSPQDLHRLNFFAKIRTRLSGDAALTLEGSGSNSAWNASGQIPQRVVESGLINRWGSINDSEGGSTGRQNMNLIYRATGSGNKDFSIQAYLSDYNFKLFSDFTFFLQDPVYGDMIEQTENRRMGGLNSKYAFRHDGPLLSSSTLGGGFRSDNIDTELWQVIQRRRYWPLVEAVIRERNFFLWGQQELKITPDLRLILGLRGDYFTFHVEDRTQVQTTGVRPLTELVKEVRSSPKPLHVPLTQPHASGFAQQGLLSPKASLMYSPFEHLDLFFNFGTGFHSNDARNVIIGQAVTDQVRVLREHGLSEVEIIAVMDSLLNFDLGHQDTSTLPRTMGGELGFRTRLGTRLNLGAAAWWIDVDDEFIYAGEVGKTEKRGRTRRLGTDLEARMQLLSWLWADLDLNLARGKLRDAPEAADDIPLAPSLTSTSGITMRHARGWEGSLRYRHMNDRPASEDGRVTARGYTVFDLAATYRKSHYKIDLAIENLFDTEWNEAQFATQSLLPGEGLSPLKPAPGPDLHFTPGNPFNLRIGVSYFY